LSNLRWAVRPANQRRKDTDQRRETALSGLRNRRIVMVTTKELPEVVSREEWLAARKKLLVKEKELTRAYDALSAERRRLPMVKIERDYAFEGQKEKGRIVKLAPGGCRMTFPNFASLLTWFIVFSPCKPLPFESAERSILT